MDVNERIKNIEISMESQRSSLEFFVKYILQSNGHSDSEVLGTKFMEEHSKLVKIYEAEDLTELSQFYRLIMNVKPALSKILKPGEEFDMVCDAMIDNFNAVLNRVRQQVNDQRVIKKRSGPIIPGSGAFELRYYCTVCNESFDIPPEIKKKLDNDEEIELPLHCDKHMVIKIVKIEEKPVKEGNFEKIEIYPAEILMQHSNSKDTDAEYLKLLSVGIDIGSSTSHLIFSRLTLKRETSFFNMSNRFNLINREILYEGSILFTPLLDRYTIDIESVVKFCQEEYKKARITPDQVNTGAVIVTGETAKKDNADEIVRRLSSESGKFVSASAGPNFESLLGIMGSGITEKSKADQKTYMNVDIGGGTSNMAIASKGEVLSTSCINVGGRLLGFDENFKIWRIDEPTERLMEELKMSYKIGDIIIEEDVKSIAKAFAQALVEVMQGSAKTTIAKLLMMSDDIDILTPVDGYSFSGGVAEYIYGTEDATNFDDIGNYLADEIRNLMDAQNLSLIEPENKIRATVIGAGSFSLSVSGSTCYYDDSITLPLLNVPVIPIDIDSVELYNEEKKSEYAKRIESALRNYNLVEGEDTFALYFKDLLVRTNLQPFVRLIELSLPKSVTKNKPIIIILKGDGAKMLGLTLKKETHIEENLLCLDELELEAGDWIDIGEPLKTDDRKAFPVTIKSLVFNKNMKE